LAGREGRPIALFVGVLIHDRGLSELVHAFPAVLVAVPDALLVIVGDGKEASPLRQEIRALGLQDHVVMTGWQEHARLPSYYQRARAGMLPFRPGGQIDVTLANKLFDYLGAGLPVVATDVPPMRRVVSEADAGFLVPGPTPESLAEGMIRMLCLDTETWLAMSARGRALVEQRYNWTADARRFVRAVEEAAGRRGPVRRG
jgi:glycosyltransferase involved in cell wall biosynthesis